MNRRATAVAAVVLVLAGLAGCTAAPGNASTKDTSATHSPTSGAATATGSSSTATPTPMLRPSASTRTPLGAGERAWAAFSERGLSYDAWWKQLRPLLSDAARAVYVYDDPKNIPSMRITEKIHLAARAPSEPKFTAEVVVPTSKGVFGLDLERHTAKSPWLLYAIKFPPGVQ